MRPLGNFVEVGDVPALRQRWPRFDSCPPLRAVTALGGSMGAVRTSRCHHREGRGLSDSLSSSKMGK